MYAARLATALRARTGAELFGMGGPRMAAAGVDLVADYHEVAVVGITEVLHKIPSVVCVQRRLAREAASRASVSRDPGRFSGNPSGRGATAEGARHSRGILHRAADVGLARGRVRVVKRLVKRMVVIFPFEEKIYRDAGVPVDFRRASAGGRRAPDDDSRRICGPARAGCQRAPIVTLLPGSRRGEIEQHYPVCVEACERLLAGTQSWRRSSVRARCGAGSDARSFCAVLAARSAVKITRVEGATYDALAAADCAIVASGTATVEAALLGTPMVVIYRVAPVTAFFLRRMIRTPFISMVNLIAGQRVAPELIQDNFTPAAVAVGSSAAAGVARCTRRNESRACGSPGEARPGRSD